MFLTDATVLDYLHARGFVGLDAVTSGQYAVRNLSRRNRNFRVSTGTTELLVKQARQWTVSGRTTIEREAALCRRAHLENGFEPLRRLVPAPYSYDPGHSILIFEFLPGRSALFDSPHRFSPLAARRVAAAMSGFHRDMANPEFAKSFPGERPGVLSIHRWDPEDASDRSAGQREFVRLVRRHAGFADALDALRGAWSPSTLIHGDWKLENCLISDESQEIHVIDWELAAWGDPLWDAGTVLQSWWNFWVRRPEQHDLEAIRPALRAFLDAYGAAVPRVVGFAAARMLQSAWEALQKSEQVYGEAARLAQASLHILTKPDWAREQLLGHD